LPIGPSGQTNHQGISPQGWGPGNQGNGRLHCRRLVGSFSNNITAISFQFKKNRPGRWGVGGPSDWGIVSSSGAVCFRRFWRAHHYFYPPAVTGTGSVGASGRRFQVATRDDGGGGTERRRALRRSRFARRGHFKALDRTHSPVPTNNDCDEGTDPGGRGPVPAKRTTRERNTHQHGTRS